MKTKRNILITVLILAISVFAALPRSFGAPPCVDRTVTVNHAVASLHAFPEYVEICSGKTLIIQIVPPVAVGNARTIDDPSNLPKAPWITKTNTDPSKITIPVPNGTTPEIYKYSIKIEGIGTLDPRARVK